MPDFAALTGSDHLSSCNTLGYWLGTLKPDAPREELDAGELALVMTCMYSVEDQCFADEYNEIDDFTDAYFSPIAPVTLARSWCPFDSAELWMGIPLWKNIESGKAMLAAAGLWSGNDGTILDDIVPQSEDEAHFRFLLLLTLERASEREENILLVCQPGWSFESAIELPMASFGYSALSAGRLYPERVPSGAIARKQSP